MNGEMPAFIPVEHATQAEAAADERSGSWIQAPRATRWKNLGTIALGFFAYVLLALLLTTLVEATGLSQPESFQGGWYAAGSPAGVSAGVLLILLSSGLCGIREGTSRNTVLKRHIWLLVLSPPLFLGMFFVSNFYTLGTVFGIPHEIGLDLNDPVLVSIFPGGMGTLLLGLFIWAWFPRSLTRVMLLTVAGLVAQITLDYTLYQDPFSFMVAPILPAFAFIAAFPTYTEAMREQGHTKGRARYALAAILLSAATAHITFLVELWVTHGF